METFRGTTRGLILSGSPALSRLRRRGEPVEPRRARPGDPRARDSASGTRRSPSTPARNRRAHQARVRRGHAPHHRGLAAVRGARSSEETVWMSHGDTVTALARRDSWRSATPRAASDAGHDHRNAAIANESSKQYGLQFHAEVDDTRPRPADAQELRHWASAARSTDLGRSGTRWRSARGTSARRWATTHRASARLGRRGLHRGGAAVPEGARLGPAQLLHIDNGLMRKDESAGVKAKLTRSLGLGDSLRVVGRLGGLPGRAGRA